MATAADVGFTFTSLELQWIRKSIELQRASLVRSLTKEIPGSDIHVLRSKEIAALSTLNVKLGGV